jgi:hypothetical protein
VAENEMLVKTIKGENIMSKKFLRASVLVLVVSLVICTGIASAVKKDPVGERILIYDGEDVIFPAGEPFHIQHGFEWYTYINDPVGNGIALSYMSLEVDGVKVKPDYVTIENISGVPYDIPFLYALKLFTFNFPDGMEGEHTFVRRYYFTCQSYWSAGVPIECKNPAELIEDPGWMQSIVVTFE